MVRIRTLTLFLLLTALLVPEGAAAEPATRIIVKREPGLTAAERADLRADAGVRLVETLSLPRTEVVTAPAGEAGAALRDLRADTDVVYAQIDHVRRSFAADPYMPYMWALQNTGQQLFGNEPGSKGYPDADSDVVEAWSQLDAPPALAGAGQTVAVVDSGIDATHLDLDGRVDYAVDFVGDRPDGSDGNGHGTHVAGTIVANRENGKGGAGVAPGAMIAAMRALNDEGQGRDSDIAAAFVQAGTEGIPIVNASLGGPEPAPLLADAIQSYPGTLFVVAAGNDGTDNDTTPQYPCNIALQNVLCVGASTNRDARASFSNYGDHSVDLFAPGESILSTIPPGVIPPPFPQTATYAYFDGTSMASPHVAAAAALVLQAKPTLTTVELKDLLMHTADDRPAFASYAVSGGRLNAAVAVATALAGGPPVDTDADGEADVVDKCPAVAAPAGPEGCAPPDQDSDTRADYADNCPVNANTDQLDADTDGQGDACDTTPRGPDVDGDGTFAVDDQCPNQFGTGPHGCPPPVVTPTPTPKPPVAGDADHDGHADASDGCKYEPAATLDGCPLPAVSSLSAKAKRCGTGRCATVRVQTSRAATVRVTLERKVCKSGRCRWVRALRKTTTTTGNVAKVASRRLKRGTYRAVIVLSSSAGRALPQTAAFRVR